MKFDPQNAVVQLCQEGITAEGFGHPDSAREFYRKAWDLASNDFEKFTAAHYMARNQEDLQIALLWNLRALQHAEAVNSEQMKPYYPSLHLNIARSYENMGNLDTAVEYYRRAAEFIPHLSKDGYGRMIESGIQAALRRLQQPLD